MQNKNMNSKFQNIKGIENIDEDTILQIVKSDPTYNENTQRGKYSFWLLNLYIFNKLKLEDLYKAEEYLSSFEDNKKYLENKDIQQFHSLQDLYTSLSKIKKPELTKSQFNRKVKNIPLDDNINIKHYMSTKYYDIYIPLTYEGSIRLGKGTQWCTATEETDEHYKIYTKDGTLYVLINKKNPKIKYQFHNETKELANNNDYSLSPFTFAKLDKGLIDFFQTFYDDLDFKKTVDFIKEFKSGVIYDGNKITCNGQLVPPILYEHITKLIIKEGVKKIKNGGFSDKHLYDDYPFGNLKEVIFPDSLVEIGSNCFSGAPYYKSNLSTIYISKNISKIGKSCFSYHPLKRIIVDKDNETFDSRDDCNAIIETNTNTLIKGSSNTIIPKSIKSIGDDAFLGNNAIKRISIPSNIEEIGDCCFAYCWKLNKIHLSNGLKIIGTDAFYSCSYIERIKLPDTVEVIGSFAFRDTNISTFQLPKNLKRLGEYIYSFTDINNIEKLHVSKHIEYLTPISFGNIGINNISVDPDNKKYICLQKG